MIIFSVKMQVAEINISWWRRLDIDILLKCDRC